MIAKIWQKLGLIILLIVCLFNILSKFVYRVSLDKELQTTIEYVQSEESNKNK